MQTEVSALLYMLLASIRAYAGKNAVFRVEAGAVFVEGIRARVAVPRARELPGRTAVLLRSIGAPDARLSEVARVWLEALEHGQTVRGDELVAMARRTTWPSRANEADELIAAWRRVVDERLEQSGGRADLEGNSALFDAWPRRVLRDPEWAFVDAPLPSMGRPPLDDVWVDLRLLPPDLSLDPDAPKDEIGWMTEPASLALDRIQNSAVFLGAPGSGKTTLLKWVARLLIKDQGGRFVLPLWVPLRRYALAWRARGGEPPSMLDFALQQCGVLDAAERGRLAVTVSYLAGSTRENVLLLLDGWDEVPPDLQALLADDIDRTNHAFAMIITSRYSGFPRRLRADTFFEVAELSPANVDDLVRRWFEHAGAPMQASALLRHLDRQPDLRRLARNPFLLTLLCGIGLNTDRGSELLLPGSRSELYRRATELIVAHHNAQIVDPWEPFTPERRKVLARLALHLAEADPSRYEFDSADVAQVAGAEAEALLISVLKPSRLIKQVHLDEERFQLVHTTFQEYLAASALVLGLPEELARRMDERGHEPAWQEILRFAAGADTELSRAFWGKLSERACSLDRFGVLAMRFAYLVAETGALDGGEALLGVDLRELLWAKIDAGVEVSAFTDAYADLDPSDFVRRAVERIRAARAARKDARQGGVDSWEARVLRALGRVRSHESSRSLVDEVMGGSQGAFAVASYAAAEVLEAHDRDRLRSLVKDSTKEEEIRARAIRTLANARDLGVVSALSALAGEGGRLGVEAIRALGRIGGGAAVSVLVGLLRAASADALREPLINALGDVHHPDARDALLEEASVREEDDPLLLTILGALAETPIRQGSEVLMEWLRGGASPELRAAAAWALSGSTAPGSVDALAAAARDDGDGEVREAALGALRDRARPVDSFWLAEQVRQRGSHPDAERALSLTALVRASVRFASHADGPSLVERAARHLLLSLDEPRGEVARAAATDAHLVKSPEVAARLTAIVAQGKGPLLEPAIVALGKLAWAPAAPVLFELVQRAPDTPSDEELTTFPWDARAAQRAAEALARIDPAGLNRIPGRTAEHALTRHSLQTGCLFYPDRVLDPRGRPIGRPGEPADEPAREPVAEPPPGIPPLLLLRPHEHRALVRGRLIELEKPSQAKDEAKAVRWKYPVFAFLLALARARGVVVRDTELGPDQGYVYKAASRVRAALRSAAVDEADARLLRAAIQRRGGGYCLVLDGGACLIDDQRSG